MSVYFDPSALLEGENAPLSDVDWIGEHTFIPAALVKEDHAKNIFTVKVPAGDVYRLNKVRNRSALLYSALLLYQLQQALSFSLTIPPLLLFSHLLLIYSPSPTTLRLFPSLLFFRPLLPFSLIVCSSALLLFVSFPFIHSFPSFNL